MDVPALIAEALRTKRASGIGLWRQLWQATLLRWSRGRLDPWEYYSFQVFLDRYSMNEKRRFIGWRREIALDRMLNRGTARELANDKLKFATFMHARAAPLPRIVAVYRPDGRGLTGAIGLHDPAAAAEFLAARSAYPLFAKPIRGAHGRLARALREPADGAALLADLQSHGDRGYLFQELLRTHGEIGAICGDRLTSARVVVLTRDDTPRILSAVWRVPTGDNATDNFDVGFAGNLVGRVDVDSGSVDNVVQGAGWRSRPTDCHPDTGHTLRGFRLPDWPAARKLCLRCAEYFPGLRLQHWDIALTNRGPVILELNVAGGLRTPQIVAPGPGGLRALYDARP